jgi:ABC-2 type transport system permease protein
MKRFLARAYAIAAKEVVQLRRDRLTLGMVVGIPALQLLLFGYAINTDVRHLKAAVADQAGTRMSRELVTAVEASQVADVVAVVHTTAELEELLRQGRVSVGVLIPPDFERRLAAGERPAAQLLVDASDPVLLGTARGLVNLDLGDPLRQAATAARTPLFEVRAYYNPERRSEVQIVPGLIGVILTLTLSLFTAIAIVRERERGTLEFLINTPVRTSELMVGKILPYIVIGLVQVTIVLALGRWLFQVPVRGSLVDLYLASCLFIGATLSFGLLISTLAGSQFQSMQMTMFFFLPSILLSGFMFPYEGMPRVAQYFAEVLPLTHFVRMVRGIILRGASFAEVSRDGWPLLAFFAVTLTASMLRFRKRLD